MKRTYKRQRPHTRCSVNGKSFSAGRGRVVGRPFLFRSGKHVGFGPSSDFLRTPEYSPVTGYTTPEEAEELLFEAAKRQSRGRIVGQRELTKEQQDEYFDELAETMEAEGVDSETIKDNIDLFKKMPFRGRVFQAEHDVEQSYAERGSVTPKASSKQVQKFEDIDFYENALNVGLESGDRGAVGRSIDELGKFSAKDLKAADDYFFEKDLIRDSSRFGSLMRGRNINELVFDADVTPVREEFERVSDVSPYVYISSFNPGKHVSDPLTALNIQRHYLEGKYGKSR